MAIFSAGISLNFSNELQQICTFDKLTAKKIAKRIEANSKREKKRRKKQNEGRTEENEI